MQKANTTDPERTGPDSDSDEQTPLNDGAIKIRLSTRTNARSTLLRPFDWLRHDADSDRGRVAYHALPAVGTKRQKTNIVIETVEEAAGVLTLASMQRSYAHSRQERDAIERVSGELTDELLWRGYEVDRDDRYDPFTVTEVDGARGDPPLGLDFGEQDIVLIRYEDVDFIRPGCRPDEDKPDLTRTFDARVFALGETKVLIGKKRIRSEPNAWVDYDVIVDADHEAREEELARAERRAFIRSRREQVDWDALLDYIKRHVAAKAAEVWPGGTVPVDEITFEWNGNLSNSGYGGHGGFYYSRNYNQRNRRIPWSDLPMISLNPHRYIYRGLGHVLAVARHECIHAWQDYHENGHPDGTYSMHGHDFDQWVNDMETEQIDGHRLR